MEARWPLRLWEESSSSLVLGEIVLDDPIDDGAGLACAGPSVDDDVRI
ncbi:uncharacterized protein METZ01_LOCUS77544 [marine metagenome]|uniref:Uncharacterized protein n=1 Tax=marine metagenome TaxID=408172 RepID=A0A381U8Z4_9ZZZZ